MPGRSPRNSAITAKLEGTSGVDAAPSVASDAVLYYAQGLDCKVSGLYAERDVIRGGFGAPDQLLYARRGSIGYSIELAGSGTAGTAPPWARQMLAAAMAEAVTAASRVEYSPVSTALKTLTHWAYWDGVVRKFVYGSASSARVRLKVGEAPMLDVAFASLVKDLPSALALPSPTLTAWKRPQAVGPLGTAKLKLGGTYSAGVVSGGTDYSFSEMVLDFGLVVDDLPLATDEAIDITGRSPTCTLTLQCSAAEEVALHALLGSTTTVGVTHGTVAGNRLTLFAAGGIVRTVEDAAQGNRLLTRVELTLPPVAAAGDEFRIVSH